MDASTIDAGADAGADALTTPDARPDGVSLDTASDRPPPGDAPPVDVPDKFGDVAETVDDATAPEGAITALVTISQTPSPLPGGFLSVASAAFTVRSGGAAAGSTCSASMIGACSVRRCMVSYADGGASPSVSLASAGVVEVDGLRIGRLALPRFPSTGLYAVNRFEEFFRGGEVIRVRATGDAAGMPPFVAAVTAPTPIVLTAPSLPAGAVALPVSVAEAMPLRWTGGGAEHVDVSIFGDSVPAFPPSTRDRTQVTVECRFPAAPGAATIPLEVMTQLRGSVSGTVSVATRQTQTYRVAPHVVTALASSTAAQWTASFP